MPLNFYRAREYILAQPFVEEVETEILRFDPFKNQKTYLGSVQDEIAEHGKKQSRKELAELRGKVRDEEKPNIDALSEVMERLNPPEGCYSLFLTPTLSEGQYGPDERSLLKHFSAGLTDCTLFEGLTESGIHLNQPVQFSHLLLELRLRQEVARRLCKQYNLRIQKVEHDYGLIVETRKMPMHKDINDVLNFCIAYSQFTNTDRFRETATDLARSLERKISAVTKGLISAN